VSNYKENAVVSKGSFVSLDKDYYFINYKDNYSLYRIDDKNLKTKIYNEKIKNLTAHKVWIYFTDHDFYFCPFICNINKLQSNIAFPYS